MSYNIYLLLLLSISTAIGYTQENTTETFKYNKNKGKLYFYWGGNRSKYSKSDIEFEGKTSLDNIDSFAAEIVLKSWMKETT